MVEKIFISYSRKDAGAVVAFKDEIERNLGPGICWIDKEGINHQDWFTKVIINAINNADYFLYMHSANSEKSEWTQKEIEFAEHKKKTIVVVQIDDSPFSDEFIFSYGGLQRSNLSDPQSKAKLLSDLKSWILPESPDGVLVSEPESLSEPSFKDETITVNGVSFKMIAVQGGTFMMGSNSGYNNEKPVHEVTLSSYHIGETVVTQQLWGVVMRNNPSKYRGSQNPVEIVSWYDSQEFIIKLNSLTGKKFRLPTEAEWEYAARGGNKSKGYKYSGSNDIDDVAWYDGDSGTHPVKTKFPNELGIYDMSGNVFEWCNDWYGIYPSSPVTNPTGPSNASIRVNRGGGWFTNASRCRVSDRYGYNPAKRFINIGLRLAF